MHVSLWQALLIGVVYYIGSNGTPWLSVNASWVLKRPMITGLVVGIILGDPIKGLIVGATINITYLAQITAGGAQTMDEGLAGAVGTALAILTHTSAAVAVTIAVPVSLVGNLLWMVYMTGDIYFVHVADKAAKKGDINKVVFYNVIPSQLFKLILYTIPVTIAVYSGSDVLQSFLDSIKGTPIINILTVIGTILPALGISMNFNAIISNAGYRAYLYFLLGFVLAIYLKLPMIVIGVVAVIFALLQKSSIDSHGTMD
ncbi:PTS mannose/fructose/sorbose/N-acetylgalactosamine transporter subunit IIC [Liquorilactobacillus satsumensis]|uniref:PTS mannose/fructose/sorbose/N-acetylgalactosamine transporter subunit IIC n=1 Tax=Liquorilactobacillus satsumensis TaxID=259059 RepID=UPI001E4A7DFB|nr:PTS sugar transporter subunit IIC [Liquorilactobacillus satsumensis]MCC7667791.1 PTS N-acetylgalactosamine transporter subunit IID [Liquorilactobacillus satsumensis]MCP9356898.1 PTS sugar transporter subunit IIC [Liquorilactobacillus satsumensis]MCP9370845.1 PTS sugar transporter subunit IIC [Liquorilactobacillus satsumensis]